MSDTFKLTVLDNKDKIFRENSLKAAKDKRERKNKRRLETWTGKK